MPGSRRALHSAEMPHRSFFRPRPPHAFLAASMFFRALGALQIASLLLQYHLAWAAIVNRTIDDTFGDSDTHLVPVYFPATDGTWKDQTCIGCAISLDTKQAFKQTYTAATYSPSTGKISVTLTFNGTAIWVYFILPNNNGEGITTITDCDFTMNKDPAVNFRHAPDLTKTDADYNQLVYSRTDLPFATHTLEISTQANFNTYINFDYAIYTHDDDGILGATPTSATGTTTTKTTTSSGTATAGGASSKSHSPTGAIAGGVVGGIVAVAAIILLLFFRRRQKRERQKGLDLTGDDVADPYIQENAYHRGPSTISPFGVNSSQAPLYSPVVGPEGPTAPSGPGQYPSSISGTEYSSNPYGGNGEFSDRATTITGTTSSHGVLPYMAAAGSSAAGSAYPPEKGRRLRVLAPEGGGDSLAPPSSVGATTLTNSEEKNRIRQARQAEIRLRLHTVENEMNEITRDIKRGSGSPQNVPQGDANEIAEMREQMRMMQQEIGLLRENQASEWAQGLTDEPPPGYSPVGAPQNFSGGASGGS